MSMTVMNCLSPDWHMLIDAYSTSLVFMSVLEGSALWIFCKANPARAGCRSRISPCNYLSV